MPPYLGYIIFTVKKIVTHMHDRRTTKEVLTMKKKAIFTLLASSAALGIIGFSGVALQNAEETAHATAVLAKKNASAFDFGEEVELPSENLSVGLTSSTTTDLTQSFTINISSQVIGFKNDYDYANVYIACDDPEFSPSLPSNEDDETKIPVFDAYVYNISGTKSTKPHAYIPEYLAYGTRAKFHVVAIASKVVTDEYKNLSSIFIPESVESIASGAFLGVPDTCTIKCAASKAGAGWESGWTDAKTIRYNQIVPNEELLNQDSSGSKTFSNGYDYMVGYYGEGKLYQPLVASFDVINGSSKTNRQQVVGLQSTNTNYDAVGGSVGTTALTLNFDIPLAEGEKVDEHSLRLHNIYDLVEGQRLPDVDKGGYYAVPEIRYKKSYALSDFIEYKAGIASSFGGYTQVDLNVTKIPGIYEDLKEAVQEEFAESLANGSCTLRYQFYALTLSSFVISYKNGTETISKTVRVSSPVSYCLIEGGENSEVGFIFKDADVGESFTYENIQAITLKNFYIKLDIYNNETHSIVKKSSIATRFGEMTLMNKTNHLPSSYVNITVAVILTIVIYAVVFAGGSTAYYFYFKNKYKNDEFRRMNTKRFLFAAGKNFVGFGIVTLALFFIISRWGIMNTSVVSYNPLDAFVIVFGVLGLIFIGFAIKNLVVAIKQARKNREALRLKLDEDVADDGTK